MKGSLAKSPLRLLVGAQLQHAPGGRAKRGGRGGTTSWRTAPASPRTAALGAAASWGPSRAPPKTRVVPG
eukprot:14965524-Heterocapsa_arctica.AAC.1